VQGKKGEPSRLIPLSQTSFKQVDVAYYKLEFIKNATGQVDG